jgi:hypothetical protein
MRVWKPVVRTLSELTIQESCSTAKLGNDVNTLRRNTMNMITIELSLEQCQAILSKASKEDLAFIDKDEGWMNIPEALANWRAALSIIQAEMEYQSSQTED